MALDITAKPIMFVMKRPIVHKKFDCSVEITGQYYFYLFDLYKMLFFLSFNRMRGEETDFKLQLPYIIYMAQLVQRIRVDFIVY